MCAVARAHRQVESFCECHSLNDIGFAGGGSVLSKGTQNSSSMGSSILMRFPGVPPKRQVFQLAGSRQGETPFAPDRPPPMLHPDVIKHIRMGGYAAASGKYDRAGRPVSPLNWQGGILSSGGPPDAPPTGLPVSNINSLRILISLKS